MSFKKNSLVSTILGISSLFLLASPVFAHVIVYPHQTGIAESQDFTVSVPNERDNPVVSVRLLVPNGLHDVLPNTISGWTIKTKSKGSGDEAVVSEIDWSDGLIPVGQRVEFIFQAQVPPQPTTLKWKAYQTYSDGTVVSWDVDPAKLENLTDSQQDALVEKQNKGEYSTTQVIDDLAASNAMTASINSASQSAQTAQILAAISVVLSTGALVAVLRKK